MKNKLVYQLGVAFLAVVKAAGVVIGVSWRLFVWLLRYLYCHREQIMRHRLTVPALVVLSLGWAAYRTVQYYSHPAPAINLTQTEAMHPTWRSEYVRLTGRTAKNASGAVLIRRVSNWLGTPHRDGSESRSGTDCSGFVRQVYREAFGIELKRSSSQMYAEDVEVIDREDLREGDLVFFNTYGSGISHVGIYLDNGRFVHTSTSRGVTVDWLDSPYYRKNYYGSGRVKGIR